MKRVRSNDHGWVHYSIKWRAKKLEKKRETKIREPVVPLKGRT